jgi:hypothetical protein
MSRKRFARIVSTSFKIKNIIWPSGCEFHDIRPVSIKNFEVQVDLGKRFAFQGITGTTDNSWKSSLGTLYFKQ